MFANQNNQSMATFVNTNVGFSGNKAQLFVMSPKIIPDQVVRPYEYNFNDKFVSDLIENRTRTSHLLTAADQSPVFASAIIPSNTNCHQLNVNSLSTSWTFVLIVDYVGQYGKNMPINGFTGLGMKTRFIATGYCYDTPINPLTMYATDPTPNPDCILQITHHTVVKMDANGINNGHNGMHNGLMVTKNDDEITQQNQMISNADTNLYLATPDIIADSRFLNSPDTGSAVFSGPKPVHSFHNNSVSVETLNNSPRNQLSNLTLSIESGLDALDSANYGATSHLANQYGQTSNDLFQTAMKSNLIGSNEYNTNTCIDPHQPVSIGQLDMMFPNLHIQPCEIPNNSQWSVVPQTEMSPNNTISFVISSTLSAMAISYGIYEASFSYSSHQKQRFDNGIGFKDPYELSIFNLIVGADANTVKGTWFGFKAQLENSLFPIIKTFGGDFDLLVHFSATGETLVNLHYLDDGAWGAPKGFYETSNKLGGLVSPLVSNMQHLENNANQFNTLTNTIFNHFS